MRSSAKPIDGISYWRFTGDAQVVNELNYGIVIVTHDKYHPFYIVMQALYGAIAEGVK